MVRNNFYLYFARFCRHYCFTKEWKDILTFLDLTHSFRCLIDVKTQIDEILTEEEYKCKFKYISNLKDLKRNSTSGITAFNSFNIDQGVISNTSFTDRCLSKEELDNLTYVEPQYQNRVASFSDWLGWDCAPVKVNDEVLTINRELVIKRIANKFSASHPYESKDKTPKSENIKLKHYHIDQWQNVKIGNYNLGYLLIQKYAEELLHAVLDFLLIDSSNIGHEIFKKCKNILSQN